MDVGGRHILVAGLLQRLLEGASPELVVAERRHHGQFGGEQIAEEGVQAADERGRHDVARHHSHVGLRVLGQIPYALQERREALMMNRVQNIIHPQMQV